MGMAMGTGPKNFSKTVRISIFEVSFFVVYKSVFWNPALIQVPHEEITPKNILLFLWGLHYILLYEKSLERNLNGEDRRSAA
jgi:hypothetical protein